MAKRKRLTPANPDYLEPGMPAPETKSMFPMGVAPTRSFKPAPIADVAHDSAASAALEEMADTLRRAREEGRLVLDLPLEAIDETYLVRDRTRIDADEMASLCASIEARGQQTPIEVVALEAGRYGLISGWRRLSALRQLAAAPDGGKFDTVQALLRRPDDSAEAYLAMVEENEIRVGLSYYERARIAARAVEQGVFETHKAALLSLFRSASRAKRSKIRSFLSLVAALDDVLRFPEDIGERMGLQISRALEADAGAAARFRRDLDRCAADSAEAEKICLQKMLKERPEPSTPVPAPDTPRPGIKIERPGASRVVVHGPAVDDRLYQRLLAFLATVD